MHGHQKKVTWFAHALRGPHPGSRAYDRERERERERVRKREKEREIKKERERERFAGGWRDSGGPPGTQEALRER